MNYVKYARCDVTSSFEAGMNEHDFAQRGPAALEAHSWEGGSTRPSTARRLPGYR